MPQPTSSQVHVDRPLTNISIAYMQNAANFVAARVFPVVPVAKQSDRYFTYDKRDWFRVEVRERAPATESAGSGFRLDSTPSYFAPVFAVHKDVDDQTRKNADEPIDLDRDATEWVTQQHLIKRELEWASKYFVTGAGWSESTPSPIWSLPSSTPIEDITNKGVDIARATGYRPNVLVIPPDVFMALKNHPDILDRIKYTQTASVTADILARLFEVERVEVSWGVRDASAEAAAASAIDFVLGDNALLVYANPTPSILKPSGGYIFAWTGLLGAGAYTGPAIKRIPIPLKEAERIEGQMAYTPKLVAADLGHLFLDVLSAPP